MSTKAQKLLDKARNTKAGWTYSDVEALYLGFGFIVRKGEGSHRHFSHPDFPDLRAHVPEHPSQELPKGYVSTAVKNVEAVIKRTEKGSNE